VRVVNSITMQAYKAGLKSHLGDFPALITDKADLELTAIRRSAV
jgi:hypothetical protein